MRHTRGFGVGISNYAYCIFLKMLDLAPSQIYTRVFYLWKSIDLDSALVKDPCPYQLSFLSLVLERLEMCHTRVLGAGMPTNAYLTF